MSRMTREQIDKLRGDLHEHFYAETDFMDKIDALCDLALLESVRSEARRDALEEAAKVAEMMFPEDADLKTNAIAAAIRALHSPARVAERPEWDGYIRFDSDCIINGKEVKAGTSWGPFEKSKNAHSTELRK